MGLGMQIASLFATVGVNTDPLNKGLGSAKQSLMQFGGEMAKQVIGTVSLATAIYKAGQVVVDSIRDWADYADAMRISAQMAGITTEEMSRLVQAADDFRVPMETMQRSMEMALKNGFVPTIENLAALSDRLLAIDDPALRAAEASKIFGKSYADMMPFLLAGGDAIRGATAGIDANLVVTEEAAQQAKDYKDAIDNLGDAWTGMQNQLGQSTIPWITTQLEDFTSRLKNAAIEALYFQTVMDYWGEQPFNADNVGAWMYDLNAALTSESYGSDEYYQAMTDRILELTGGLADVPGYTALASAGINDAGSAADGAAPKFAELTEEELALVQASIAAAEAQARMHAELLNVTSLDANYSGIIDLGYQFTDMLAEIDVNNAKLAAMTPWQREHSKEAKDLLKANEDIEASMAKLADQVTLDMFKATIAIGGVTQAELMAYMQMAIDMGYMSEAGAKAAVDAYSNAIGTINGLDIDEKTVNVEIDALAAFATLDLLEAYALKDKHAQAIMHVQYQYGTPAGEDYDQYDIGGYPQEHGGGASGGYFMADTPYIVGERGPELFVPNANGQIVSNDMAFGGGNSDLLGDILLELQNQPSRMKVAIKEAFALVGG